MSAYRKTLRFTVLTPTHNRAHTLEGVYRSLCCQTFHDFEWVIVDDGSTDGTQELVSGWKSFFSIRYTWKPNGGKHTAVNLGVQQAAGEFILILDSDDRCVPHTLERFDRRWREIPDPDRFANLVCLCCAEDGSVVGSRLPADHVDVFSLREALALSDGERCGIMRTDVLRKFPYPVFKGERDILEGVVWNRILNKYAARYFDEALRIYVDTPGGLSNYGDRRRPNPKGAVVYHAELALSNVPFKLRLKSAINAVRFSLIAAARELHLLASKKEKSA